MADSAPVTIMPSDGDRMRPPAADRADPTAPGSPGAADAASGDAASGGFGVGAGRLSAAAQARLARGVGDPPLARPPLDDHAAVARWRRAVHRAWGEGTVTGEPPHHRSEIAGVEVLVAGPADAPVTVVYAHGGGYVLGSAGVAVPVTARLAGRLRVVSVDYRTAPEHPFPAALDDVGAVFAAVAATVPSPVALAGDSAGGALAAGTALRAATGDLPMPLALVLLCPHLDHAHPGEDPEDPEASEDHRHGDGDAAGLTAAYRAGTATRHPLLSPARAPERWLARLPPTLVQTGTADSLSTQAVRFVRRARAAGAPAVLDLWDGLWHTWQYHRELPEADRALTEAVGFVLAAATAAATTAGPVPTDRPARPDLHDPNDRSTAT